MASDTQIDEKEFLCCIQRRLWNGSVRKVCFPSKIITRGTPNGGIAATGPPSSAFISYASLLLTETLDC